MTLHISCDIQVERSNRQLVVRLRKESWADRVGLGGYRHMADTAMGIEERPQDKQVQRKGNIGENAKEH